MVFQMKRPGNHRNSQVRSNQQNIIQGFSQRLGKPESKIKTAVANTVGNIPKTLDNVQEFLKIIQSTAPIIEKYGPVVRNIPTMYKIIKSMNETVQDEDLENEDHPSLLEDDISSGQSKPRLYI